MALKDIMVSCFPNVKAKINPEHLPLLEVLESIKKGNLKSRIERVRKEKDPARRNELKVKLLPAICPSGVFERMEDVAIIKTSGVICIDLDDVTDLEKERERLKADPHVLSVFRSPTKGLKVLLLHDLADLSRHKDLYHHISTLLGLAGRSDLKFDMSCSNISHPCLWSYDPGLYLNKDAATLHIELDKLPVYTLPSKDKKVSGKTVPENDAVVPLTEPKIIRKKILESHTLFEKYYNMYPNIRNNNLFILANFFYNDSVPEDFATDYLVAYYSDSRNDFPASEIMGIVRSAYH
jgi:hypothetical protein